jgi:hypothetical protein
MKEMVSTLVRKALRNRRVWREEHSETSSLRAESPRRLIDLTGRRFELCSGRRCWRRPRTIFVPALSSDMMDRDAVPRNEAPPCHGASPASTPYGGPQVRAILQFDSW